MRSAKCEVETMECGVRSVEWRVWSVKGGMCGM